LNDFQVRCFGEISMLGWLRTRRLIHALRYDSDISNRIGAAFELGERRAVSAVQPLIDLLQDDNTQLRNQAVRTLGALGDARAVPSLVALARDGETGETAIEALGEIGGDEVYPALLEIGLNGPPAVRDRSLRQLFDMPIPKGKRSRAALSACLVPLLKDARPHVRIGAVKALGDVGDSSVKPMLISAARSDPDLAAAAAESLGRLGDEASRRELLIQDAIHRAPDVIQKLGITETESCIWLHKRIETKFTPNAYALTGELRKMLKIAASAVTAEVLVSVLQLPEYLTIASSGGEGCMDRDEQRYMLDHLAAARQLARQEILRRLPYVSSDAPIETRLINLIDSLSQAEAPGLESIPNRVTEIERLMADALAHLSPRLLGRLCCLPSITAEVLMGKSHGGSQTIEALPTDRNSRKRQSRQRSHVYVSSSAAESAAQRLWPRLDVLRKGAERELVRRMSETKNSPPQVAPPEATDVRPQAALIECECGKRYRFRLEHLGRKTTCPACGRRITLAKTLDGQ
jgi:hypothetical protein